MNQRGGAAIVPGKLPLLLEDELYFANDMEAANGAPTLTVFMWENGAYFEHILAQYTSATFPSGIDPSTLRLAHFSSTGNESGGYLNVEVGTNVTKPVDTASDCVCISWMTRLGSEVHPCRNSENTSQAQSSFHANRESYVIGGQDPDTHSCLATHDTTQYSTPKCHLQVIQPQSL